MSDSTARTFEFEGQEYEVRVVVEPEDCEVEQADHRDYKVEVFRGGEEVNIFTYSIKVHLAQSRPSLYRLLLSEAEADVRAKRGLSD